MEMTMSPATAMRKAACAAAAAERRRHLQRFLDACRREVLAGIEAVGRNFTSAPWI